jgi:hypothetical protein
VNRVKSCDANLRVWVAKQPTGDATKVGGEVPRWYLWARALHWLRLLWYEGKIR